MFLSLFSLNLYPSCRLFYLNIGARNTHISRICTGICRRWRIQWMVPDVTIKPGYTWNRKRSHLFQGPSSHQYTRSHSVSNNYEYMYIYGCMWGGVEKIPSSSPFSWNFQRNVNLTQNYACLVPSLLTFLGATHEAVSPVNSINTWVTRLNLILTDERNKTHRTKKISVIRLKLYTRITPA